MGCHEVIAQYPNGLEYFLPISNALRSILSDFIGMAMLKYPGFVEIL